MSLQSSQMDSELRADTRGKQAANKHHHKIGRKRHARHTWRQRARAIILELADGDFARVRAQYEGYTT